MTNFQFLQLYIELQKDIMFDKIFDLDFATVCYNQNDPYPFWNNALTDSNLDLSQINKVEIELNKLNRDPAFYFEDKKELMPLQNNLLAQKYKKIAEDCFMFHSGKNINLNSTNFVKKVTTEDDLNTFISTFDKCYQKDDPLNPYGELGDYLICTRAAWLKNHESKKVEYFIVYSENEPVAVASLTNHKGIGYISNVGSLLRFRGKGFGKLATLYCLQKSIENDNKLHCLATENGTNPNSFYSALGFKTKFKAVLFSKSALF